MLPNFTERYLNTLLSEIQFNLDDARKLIESAITLSERTNTITMIHDIRNFNIIYMSSMGLQSMKCSTIDELAKEAPELLALYTSAPEENYFLQKLSIYLKDSSNVIPFTYLQKINEGKIQYDFGWYVSVSSLIIKGENDLPLLTITNAYPMKEDVKVNPKVDRIWDEMKFKESKKGLYQQLSKRELEILKRIISGETNKMIAVDLYISEETIKTHRRNIKRKLQITNDSELFQVAYAFDLK